MKTALVHHWLLRMRGGERVLAAIARLYPEAPIFTLFHDPQGLSPELREREVRASVLNRLPGAKHLYRQLLPLYPLGCRSLDLRGFDLVVTSDASLIKGVRVDEGAVHICYCHSPPRYLWDMADVYLGGLGPLRRAAARLLLPRLRERDRRAAAGVTHFVANSENVRERIRRCYGRESTVIYPPVEVFEAPAESEPGNYYMFLGHLTAYKRPDLAVSALTRLGRRLLVVGEGPELKRLRRLAGPSVEFPGWKPDAEVRRLLAGCRALIFPGEEDFGIVPVEAQMAGRPVIALRKGGALETVVENSSGLFFDEPTPESLAEALLRFEDVAGTFSREAIRENALRFRPETFAQDFADFAAGSVG